ncbi:hypothetical protein QX776_09680 [Alteromonadaceae bacterium BrNp21-10]|nr:hypothetical protein [Alteromonadaceae bacterium BrNp21-10]
MLQLSQRTVRVVDCLNEGSDAHSYILEPFNFIPVDTVNIGQFFQLDLPGGAQSKFVYTVLPQRNGHFKLLCANGDKRLQYKLKKGMILGYAGPFGRGWPVDKLIGAEVLIVAGDAGLAPVASVIDFLIAQGQQDNTTVIYGSQSSTMQILSKEREYWRSKLLLYETVEATGEQLAQGSPAEFISTLLADHDRQPQIVLTCGSDSLMIAVADLCRSLVIGSSNIWLLKETLMQLPVCGCASHRYSPGNASQYDPIRCYEQLFSH